jgi:hypothetical protein
MSPGASAPGMRITIVSGSELRLQRGRLGFLESQRVAPRAQIDRPPSPLNTPTEILLHGDSANILFVGSPDCVLPDASGKFFAHF